MRHVRQLQISSATMPGNNLGSILSSVVFPSISFLKTQWHTIRQLMNMPVQQYFYHKAFVHNHTGLSKTIFWQPGIGEMNTIQMNYVHSSDVYFALTIKKFTLPGK